MQHDTIASVIAWPAYCYAGLYNGKIGTTGGKHMGGSAYNFTHSSPGRLVIWGLNSGRNIANVFLFGKYLCCHLHINESCS